jgi:hypothetical protein
VRVASARVRRRLLTLPVLLAAACSGAPEPVPAVVPVRQPPGYAADQRRAIGDRFDLPQAELFVPRGYEVPADGLVPLFVHFQGGVPVAEENFVRCARPGVLIASRLAGRSSAFAAPYRDPNAFATLLTLGERLLSDRAGRSVTFAPITITFFSAGYGAVRELLRHPPFVLRIAALVAVDSIYADTVPGTRQAQPEQMRGFVAFAQAAAQGDKTFVVAHSRIATEYASTAECADALLAALGLQRHRVSDRYSERGVPVTATADRGNFHLLEFAESDPGIHVDILYMVPELVRAFVPHGAP